MSSLPKIEGLKILRHLGGGHQSDVYEADFNGQKVAVKFQKGKGQSLESAKVHFLREATYLALLHGSGLPAIIDIGEKEGTTYILQQLLEGQSLGQRLEKGSLDEKEVLSLAIQLLLVLERVHKRNLIHRDIKPRNIIYNRTGEVYLIDFGLAVRVTTKKPEEETAGTFLYASPEQGGGLERAVDERSDLYSLGIVLYECVTGKVPFVGHSISELIRKHALEKPESPLMKNSSISKALNDMILKLIEKDPDDRYQSAHAVLCDIQKSFSSENTLPWLANFEARANDIQSESCFIGRKDILESFKKEMDTSFSGQGRVVLISGASGTGKTRLTEEVLSHAQRQGALLLSGKCAQTGSPLPFAPLREALENLLVRSQKHTPEKYKEVIEKVKSCLGGDVAHMRGFTRSLSEVLPVIDSNDSTAISLEQFYGILSQFFKRLIFNFEKVVLFIDDVQWMDEASLKFLRYLRESIPQMKFLLIGSSRDDEKSQDALARFRDEVGDSLTTTFSLAAFDRTDSQLYIQEILGGRQVSDEIVEQIFHRSAGLPFAIGEYVRSFLDEGLLFPKLKSWQLDSAGLQKVKVSSDVIELVLHRAKQLSLSAQQLLSVAALWGPRFPIAIIGRSLGFENKVVLRLLEEATNFSLLETKDDAREYFFTHDKIQEAFASFLDIEEQKKYHRYLAVAIEQLQLQAVYIYELADHYRAAMLDEDTNKIIHTCLVAGEKAFREYAAQEAFNYFETSFSLSAQSHFSIEHKYIKMRAEVCALVGKYKEAFQLFQYLLDVVTDNVEKARIHNRLARIHAFHREIGKSWYHVTEGLRLVGVWRYRHPILFWIQVIYDTAKGLISDLILKSRKTLNPEEIQKFQVAADLSEVGGVTAYHLNNPFKFASIVGPSIYPAVQMGDSKELAIAYAAFAAGLGVVGLKKLSLFYIDKSLAVAQKMGDPFLLTRASLLCIYVHQFGNEWQLARQMAKDLVQNNLRYLEGNDLMNATFGGMSNMTVLSGHLQDGLKAMELAVDFLNRIDSSGQLALSHTFLSTLLPIYANLGRLGEAQSLFAPMQHFVEKTPDDTCGAIGYYGSVLGYYNEIGETGPPVDRAIQKGLKHAGPFPFLCMPHFKYFYVYAAYARAEQYFAAHTEEDRKISLEKLIQQWKLLKLSGLLPSWSTVVPHAYVIEATIYRLQRKWNKAERALVKALRLANQYDLPLVVYEVFVQQAFLARDQGYIDAAKIHARSAMFIAHSYQWTLKVQKLHRIFEIQVSPGGSGHSIVQELATSNSSRREVQLNSLIQICTNSVGLSDLQDQCRQLLDDVIRFFGADRGFVFLGTQEQKNFEMKVGRTSSLADLTLAEQFSKKSIERAYRTRSALIINIDESMTETGNESIIANNLRSILVAPLIHRDKILGAIYLDNRAVKGLFQDVDKVFISAAASILAATIESHRAALLEIEKAALTVKEKASKEIKFLMDNLQEAVFLIDHQKTVLSPVSQYSEKLFGFAPDGKNLLDVLYSGVKETDELYSSVKTALDVTFGEGDLQWDLSSHLLSGQVTRTNAKGQKNILDVRATPIWSNEQTLERIMYTVTDETEKEALRVELKQASEKMNRVYEVLGSPRNEVSQFLNQFEKEISRYIHNHSLRSGKEILRNLHTLKGASRIIGLKNLASYLHSSEFAILTAQDQKDADKEYLVVLQALKSEVQKYKEVESLIASWAQLNNRKSTNDLFWFLNQAVEDAAKSLNKKVRLSMRGRLDLLTNDQLESLKTVGVHLLRNAVDHGIETESERLSQKKMPEGAIIIDITEDKDVVNVLFKDDGRGIDIQKLIKKAAQAGINTAEVASPFDLIFHSGLSTRDEVTEYSGRGVGLDAVKAELERNGHHIKVDSSPGVGTTFTMSFKP